MKACSYCGRDNEDDALNCGECGSEFQLPDPEEDRTRLEDPAGSLVILKTFGTVIDATLLRTRLEAAGIEACIPEEYTPQIFWGVVPSPLEAVTVRVAARDYDAARELLSEYTSAPRTAAPGLSQLEEPPAPPAPMNPSVPKSQPIPELPDDSPRKTCVCCGAAIPESAAFCPKCEWTQP